MNEIKGYIKYELKIPINIQSNKKNIQYILAQIGCVEDDIHENLDYDDLEVILKSRYIEIDGEEQWLYTHNKENGINEN